jgi:hypothetical protein
MQTGATVQIAFAMIDFIAGGISLIGSVILLAPIYIVYLVFKG